MTMRMDSFYVRSHLCFARLKCEDGLDFYEKRTDITFKSGLIVESRGII